MVQTVWKIYFLFVRTVNQLAPGSKSLKKMFLQFQVKMAHSLRHMKTVGELAYGDSFFILITATYQSHRYKINEYYLFITILH